MFKNLRLFPGEDRKRQPHTHKGTQYLKSFSIYYTKYKNKNVE